MNFVLYDSKEGCYYGGEHKKYQDMINITTRDCAKIYPMNEAVKIKEILNKNGWSFILQESI